MSSDVKLINVKKFLAEVKRIEWWLDLKHIEELLSKYTKDLPERKHEQR